MASLAQSPKTRSAILLARLGLIAAAVLTLGACANVIGLDGVEYDRRLCGSDSECNLPSICRGNASGTFYCEPPPANGAKFGQDAYANYTGTGANRRGVGVANCLSGVDDGKVCTRPCRAPKDCGNPLPACKNLPLGSDGSRVLPVCQAQ